MDKERMKRRATPLLKISDDNLRDLEERGAVLVVDRKLAVIMVACQTLATIDSVEHVTESGQVILKMDDE